MSSLAELDKGLAASIERLRPALNGHACAGLRVADPHGEVVDPDHRRDHAETETRTRDMARLRAPVELFQHRLAFAGRNTRSVVDDIDLWTERHPCECYTHRFACRGELDRIINQVAERLEQQRAVGENGANGLYLYHELN
jgi:hypothetical protein